LFAIEERWVQGLPPELIKKILEKTKELLEHYLNRKEIQGYTKLLHDKGAQYLECTVLSVFYSLLICEKLDWWTRPTLEKVCLGCILQDIDALNLQNLPPLAEEDEVDPSSPELSAWQKHPLAAADKASSFNFCNESVRQIIIQHHENFDGSGFPRHIAGLKIYPLARIVRLATYLSKAIIFENYSLKTSVQQLLKNTQKINSFDPQLIKQIISALTGKSVEEKEGA